MLLDAAKLQSKCPSGVAFSPPSVNLTEGKAGYTCKSPKLPIAKLCPANGRPKPGDSGSSSIARTGVSTEEVSIKKNCVSEACYPGTFEWKGGCIACPKGTRFDQTETEQAFRKGSLDRSDVLCVGPKLLEEKFEMAARNRSSESGEQESEPQN